MEVPKEVPTLLELTKDEVRKIINSKISEKESEFEDACKKLVVAKIRELEDDINVKFSDLDINSHLHNFEVGLFRRNSFVTNFSYVYKSLLIGPAYLSNTITDSEDIPIRDDVLRASMIKGSLQNIQKEEEKKEKSLVGAYRKQRKLTRNPKKRIGGATMPPSTPPRPINNMQYWSPGDTVIVDERDYEIPPMTPPRPAEFNMDLYSPGGTEPVITSPVSEFGTPNRQAVPARPFAILPDALQLGSRTQNMNPTDIHMNRLPALDSSSDSVSDTEMVPVEYAGDTFRGVVNDYYNNPSVTVQDKLLAAIRENDIGMANEYIREGGLTQDNINFMIKVALDRGYYPLLTEIQTKYIEKFGPLPPYQIGGMLEDSDGYDTYIESEQLNDFETIVEYPSDLEGDMREEGLYDSSDNDEDISKPNREGTFDISNYLGTLKWDKAVEMAYLINNGRELDLETLQKLRPQKGDYTTISDYTQIMKLFKTHSLDNVNQKKLIDSIRTVNINKNIEVLNDMNVKFEDYKQLYELLINKTSVDIPNYLFFSYLNGVMDDFGVEEWHNITMDDTIFWDDAEHDEYITKRYQKMYEEYPWTTNHVLSALILGHYILAGFIEGFRRRRRMEYQKEIVPAVVKFAEQKLGEKGLTPKIVNAIRGGKGKKKLVFLRK
tara:strand:+ start:7707 stop:9695 length:1989 start_codon:yes stop_codon:yes gene_type:complete